MTEGTAAAIVPRHDFFQTETTVTISIYVRGCQQDDVQLDVDVQSLRLRIAGPPAAGATDKATTHELHIAPLYGPVDRTNSSVRVLGSKVEVALPKLEPGVRWPALAGEAVSTQAQASAAPAVQSTPQPVATPATTATASSRPNRSKWDSFKDEDDEGKTGDKANGDEEGDGGIDAFFKKLYADADDDTRRAMMKSYQESGGTALSTNWAEVSKGKVETKPPQGMEARKW